MAVTKKGMTSKIAQLEEAVKRLREREKKRRAAAAKKAASRRYDASTWTGPKPARLGVYYIRMMLDSSEIGSFGPYATVRAAAADAKNILRMHVGPGHKIVETGPVVPVIRSDNDIRLYLHPESYSTQLAGKGILSAQVIETEPPESRLETFPLKDEQGDVVLYNPRRRRPRAASRRRNGGTERDTLTSEIRALEAALPAAAVQDARSECGLSRMFVTSAGREAPSVHVTNYQLRHYVAELQRELGHRRAMPLRAAHLAKRRN
jgi:hypothetical protein